MSRNHTVARNGAKNKLDRKKLNFELTWSHRRRRRDAASMASTRPRVDGVETSRCDAVGAVAASNKAKRNHPLENIEKQTTHVIVEMDTGRVDGVVGRERAAESLGAC